MKYFWNNLRNPKIKLFTGYFIKNMKGNIIAVTEATYNLKKNLKMCQSENAIRLVRVIC